MAPNTRPPGPTPAWYRRLPLALRRVAAASDRVTTVPLRAGPALRAAVGTLAEALATGHPGTVERVAQQVADEVCASLGVPRLRVSVALRRPADARGELHGLYTPGNGRGRDQIALWMLTAKRGQVVAYRTFLRTLLHELCHHLDYELLHLRDSLHTQGFYRRESSLFAALHANRFDSI
jgi:hypothetical protein